MAKIDETTLTKGEIRKLNALRKSIGDGLGEMAFGAWLKERPAPSSQASTSDATAEAIAVAVMAMIEDGTIKGLPRGGYNLRRGRGRVVVSRAN